MILETKTVVILNSSNRAAAQILIRQTTVKIWHGYTLYHCSNQLSAMEDRSSSLHLADYAKQIPQKAVRLIRCHLTAAEH